MKRIIDKSLIAVKSSTMRDTSVLFFGNLTNAFLGFVLLLLLARVITVEEMGVFSAFTNLIILLGALCDPGISSGLVKFIAEKRSQKKFGEERKFIAAGLKIQLSILIVILVALFILRETAAVRLLATSDVSMVYILIFAVLLQVLWLFSSQTLKARRNFIMSTTADVSSGATRTLGVVVLLLASALTLHSASTIYTFGALISTLLGFYFLKNGFIFLKVSSKYYKSLLGFSGWIGVNKIGSVIASKVDVQMIAILAGATSTGFYSLPSRLIFFISILVASLSAVVAPRLAAFGDRKKEKDYILKILALSLLIIVGLLAWYVFATPIIQILFGDKYLPSVPIFRLLIISIIPFVLTAASVNAIIYGIKKPKYIGYFSIFQLISVVGLNLIFIPRFGPLGATYTLIITNTLLAIYTWFITGKYYFTG